MPINENDRFVPYQLPPVEKCWPELQPLAKKYAKLRADLNAAETRLRTFESEHFKAVEADADALAEAILNDEPDPGNGHVEKLVKERENTRRTIEALKRAIATVEDELAEVHAETRGKQVKAAEADLSEASKEYEKAVQAMEAARFKLTTAVAARRFLKYRLDETREVYDGTNRSDLAYRPGGYRPGDWVIYKLKSVNGEPYTFGQVTEALRADIAVAQTSDDADEPKQIEVPLRAIGGFFNT